jgi:hypothetical protein
MAWEIGPYFVKPKGTVDIWFSWGGDLQGPQFAQAVPGYDALRTEVLVTTNLRLQQAPDLEYTYWVTVQNVGEDTQYGVWFTLTGGTVTW